MQYQFHKFIAFQTILCKLHKKICALFTVNTSLKLRFHILITGLSKESEHILLILLYAGLVKGIYTKDISGNRTCKFKEINKVSKRLSGSVSNLKKDVGNATIVVCEESCGSCSAVNKIKIGRASCRERVCLSV